MSLQSDKRSLQQQMGKLAHAARGAFQKISQEPRQEQSKPSIHIQEDYSNHQLGILAGRTPVVVRER